MTKGLVHAIAACVLIVCVVPVDRVVASGGAEQQHPGRGSVSAGRAHTLIATPDGRVSAWGRGRRGQIGDGGLLDRWLPVEVPGLTDVVMVAAGAAHTVALTTNGDVFAWGANTFGRLGDGTRTRRVRPVRVHGLSNVTMVAAGRAHTLALTADGRVFAWGRNTDGQLGTGNRVAALEPIHVRDLSDIVTIDAGDAHSLAVTRDGRLFAWGSNRSSRLGDGTTRDRLRPVPVALDDVVAVAGGAAHSLALLRNGSVFSWGRGANGELGTGSALVAPTPVMIPGLTATAIAAGRHFSGAIQDDGSVVAWGANESGQLGDGTTLRRSRPAVVEGVSSATAIAFGDAHAIAVTRSGDVRTWGAGDSGQLGNGTSLDGLTAAEIMSDIPGWGEAPGEDDAPPDTVPPSITTSVSPPLKAGWMTTPVTVTFQCADNVAVRSCPSLVLVATEGSAQQITGTAVDVAGNQATATVVVNLDLSPPVLSIAEPQEHATTAESEITVSGLAFDLGSGITDVRCNGESATVVTGEMHCVVSLKPGRNQIILHATDAAGFNASAAVTVSRAAVTSALVLTPATRTLEVNEVATLSLRDEFGVRVGQAVWSSDSEILELSNDDPPHITARALGTATITAERDGLTAVAAIVVSARLMPGDARWALPMNFDYSVNLPIFANRVEPDGPSLFTVEGTSPADAVVRAMSPEGEMLWQQHVDGVPIMGDSFGGFIAAIVDAGQNYRAYARFGGGTIRPWRYDSAGRLGRPAQAHDGTIYAIERLFAELNQDGYEIWDKHAILLDGATGALISRTLLTREINYFYSARDGERIDLVPPGHCFTALYSNSPETLEPIVGSDGRGYLIVRRSRTIKHGECFEQIYDLPDRTIDMGLDLVVLSRTAPPQVTNFYSTSCTAAFATKFLCDYPVHAFQVMPDGIGGTLVAWERGGRIEGDYIAPQRWLTRVTANGSTERPVSDEFLLEMIGQNGVAIASDDGWKAFDVESGRLEWASASDLTPVAARPDRGMAALDSVSGELTILNGAGMVESNQSFGLWWSVYEDGNWIGFRDTNLTAVVGEFSDATRWRASSGNAQNQLSLRRPGIGLTLKSQNAAGIVPIYHTAIKIAPIDQYWLERWYSARPDLAPRRDEFNNLFITLGAGLPDGRDSALNCAVPGLERLVSDTNRDGDVSKPVRKWTTLPVAEADEFATIQRLLDLHERFSDDLPYACFPEDLTGFYNSNSYARSLLIHARVPHHAAEPKSPSPGWHTTIPLIHFPQR